MVNEDCPGAFAMKVSVTTAPWQRHRPLPEAESRHLQSSGGWIVAVNVMVSGDRTLYSVPLQLNTCQPVQW